MQYPQQVNCLTNKARLELLEASYVKEALLGTKSENWKELTTANNF